MMAKRLLGLMLSALLSIFVVKAQDSLLIFDGITPSPGSEISSFNFVLKFDFSKIIEADGPGEYGIGWVGSHNDKLPTKSKSIAIYKGSPEDGVLVGRVFNTNMYGTTSGFKISSDAEISLDGVVPEAGVTYTMVITNQFKVFTPEGGSKSVTNTDFDCYTNPLTYTFIGASASAERLTVSNCSVERNSLLKEISEVSYSFSEPVSVNDTNRVEITENGTVVAKSTSTVVSDDGLNVTYKFDNVVLYTTHSYIISLPAGAVSASNNSSVVNDTFNTPVKGDKFTVFELESSIPTSEQKTIFSTIEGIFDMPEGFEIFRDAQYTINLYAYLYKNEVLEENLLGRLNGAYNATRNGILWTNTFALEPETTYVLYKPEGEFSALDKATNQPSKIWYNGEVNIILNTPSVAEAGLTPVRFQTPVIGQHDKSTETLSENMKVGYLDVIEIAQPDLFYTYNGNKIGFDLIGEPSMYIYDITDGNENLVKEVRIALATRETVYEYYRVLRVLISYNFLAGHKYKFVIPAGYVSVNDQLIKNYASNEEWSLIVDGDTPTDVKMTSCSLQENAELSEISSIVAKFNAEMAQNPELSVRLYSTVTSEITGAQTTSFTNALTSVRPITGTTDLVAAWYSPNGGPRELNPKHKYWITIPEGLLYYPGDPSIKNAEITIPITPVAKTPEVIKPEYVNLTVEVNGITTIEQQAVKGEKATITLAPTEDWKVELIDGASQSGVNSFTTPVLTADASIKVELAYDGAWAKEISTNVYEIEEDNIRIYKDEDHIIVEGVAPEQTIYVYNIAGLLVNTANSEDGKDKVTLTVSQNQEYYIVTVAGKAAKIKM